MEASVPPIHWSGLFFFSSRRRHTRSLCDWSSDVCSSDLVLRVAGALLEHGVDPESIYESVYASAPEGRVRLTAEVLATLVVEPELGLAWVTVRSEERRVGKERRSRSRGARENAIHDRGGV